VKAIGHLTDEELDAWVAKAWPDTLDQHRALRGEVLELETLYRKRMPDAAAVQMSLYRA
jgi:hypothetical protein